MSTYRTALKAVARVRRTIKKPGSALKKAGAAYDRFKTTRPKTAKVMKAGALIAGYGMLRKTSPTAARVALRTAAVVGVHKGLQRVSKKYKRASTKALRRGKNMVTGKQEAINARFARMNKGETVTQRAKSNFKKLSTGKKILKVAKGVAGAGAAYATYRFVSKPVRQRAQAVRNQKLRTQGNMRYGGALRRGRNVAGGVAAGGLIGSVLMPSAKRYGQAVRQKLANRAATRTINAVPGLTRRRKRPTSGKPRGPKPKTSTQTSHNSNW